MKLQTVINTAKDLETRRSYDSALRLVLRACENCDDPASLANLKQWARDLKVKADSQNKADNEAKRILLQNKADTVNAVNLAAMQSAAALSVFIRDNGVETKQDGSFTKRYATKLFDYMAEVVPQGINFSTVPKHYNDPVVQLTLYKMYTDVNGNGRKYETWENVAGSGGLSIPQNRPTDRTVAGYLQAEIDLKQAEVDLRELESKISNLKRMVQE